METKGYGGRFMYSAFGLAEELAMEIDSIQAEMRPGLGRRHDTVQMAVRREFAIQRESAARMKQLLADNQRAA